MPKNKFKQGDIVWADFSPSVGQEMKGKHPAVVVSSNSYNEKTNYLMVCPITSHGNHFPTYLFNFHDKNSFVYPFSLLRYSINLFHATTKINYSSNQVAKQN